MEIKEDVLTQEPRVRTLVYRITGPQSIERLDPLLRCIQRTFSTAAESSVIQWRHAEEIDTQLDFVWETSCEKIWRDRHMRSTILNRLHNSEVLVFPLIPHQKRTNDFVPVGVRR